MKRIALMARLGVVLLLLCCLEQAGIHSRTDTDTDLLQYNSGCDLFSFFCFVFVFVFVFLPARMYNGSVQTTVSFYRTVHTARWLSGWTQH